MCAFMKTNDYNLLLANMPVAYALHEMLYNGNGKAYDYKFIDVNNYFEKITGVSVKDVVGKTCMQLFPETEQYWIDTFEKCIIEKSTVELENYSASLNGYYKVTAFSPMPGYFITMTHDVTSERKKQKELALNEQRYRLSQEVGKTGSWEYYIAEDRYWNSPEFRRIFGIDSNDEDINGVVEQCIIDKSIVNNALVRLIEENAEYNIEFEIKRYNDGAIRVLNSRARIVYDSIVQSKVVFGYLVDITEIKQNESNLKQSKAVLSSILKHSRFSIWSIGSNRELVFQNELFRHNFHQLNGFYPKVGMRLTDFIPGDIKELWERLYFRVLKGESFVEELDISTEKNQNIIEVSATAIYVDAKVVGASFYAKDITDEKKMLEKIARSESEANDAFQKFDTIFRNNSALMMLTDISTLCFIDVNNAFLKVTGYDRADVVGKTPWELNLVHAEDRYLFKKVGKIIEEKSIVEDMEIRLLKKDGGVITCVFSGQYIHAKEQKFGLSVMIDVTERKFYEELQKNNTVNLRKIVEFSSIFMKTFLEDAEFDAITDMVREISGVKHVVFNTLTDTYSEIKSVSSDHFSVDELNTFLNIDILKKKWPRMAKADKKWIHQKSTLFENISELSAFGVPIVVLNELLLKHNLQKFILLRVEGTKKVVGNFMLFYTKEDKVVNTEMLEIFSYQVGQYIERYNTEIELRNKMNEMERFYKLTVDREHKMISLKMEINELLNQLGKPAMYKIVG